MVKIFQLLIILFIFTINNHLYANNDATSFEARVDRNMLSYGELFTLSLDLKGANSNQEPNIDALMEDFDIVNKTNSSQISRIGNNMSVSASWHYSLLPKKEGSLEIPPIKISTNKGLLSSKKIIMNITHAKSQINDKIKVETSISKKESYVNENLIYRAKIISKYPISGIEYELPASNDFILEQIGKDKISEINDNGIIKYVGQVNLSLTPISAGDILVDSIIVRVKAKVKNAVHHNPFANLAIFPNKFSLTSNKDFVLKTDPITISSKTIAGNIDNWLPLQSLIVTQEWENINDLKIGKPIVRKIKYHATPIRGDQIPQVTNLVTNEQFKIYQDKPEYGESISQDLQITGWREDVYTIIPKKSGEIILPEVSIAWWNIESNQLEYATLPAKKLNIANIIIDEDMQISKNANDINLSDDNVENINIIDSLKKLSFFDIKKLFDVNLTDNIYQIIILGLLFCISLLLSIILKQKRSKNNFSKDNQSSDKENANFDNKLSSLKSIRSVKEFKIYVSEYAHKKWKAPKNSSFKYISEYLISSNPGLDSDKLKKLFKELDKSLYSGVVVDIDDIKRNFTQIIKFCSKSANDNVKSSETKIKINPV